MRYISQKERKKKPNMPNESCWEFIWIFWEPTVCIWKKRYRYLEAYWWRYFILL